MRDAKSRYVGVQTHISHLAATEHETEKMHMSASGGDERGERSDM